jgi:hypothetical protein
VPLARLAPGRLGSTLRLEGFGQYSVSVDDGRSVVRQRFIRHEMPVPPANQAPIAESWLEQGLLSSWSAAHAGALEGERAGRRHALLALAVGLFIVMLVYERQVVGGPWLRRQASRFRADPAGA